MSTLPPRTLECNPKKIVQKRLMLIASMGEMGLSHDNILEGDECLRQYWFEVEFLDFVSHLLYLLYEILLQTSKM